MSIRKVRELKISNENKATVQSVLDENTDIHRMLECLVYLKSNPLEYYDGLKDLNYYEIYKLVQYKILEIIEPFVSNEDITIDKKEDIYYELRLSETPSSNSSLIQEYASFLGKTNEEFLEMVIKEKEKNEHVCLRFCIDYKNDRIKNILEVVFDNIKISVDNFLSNFYCRDERMNSQNFFLNVYCFDSIEIQLELPFFLFSTLGRYIFVEDEE